ncbi:fasciclin domain-containing protein [Janibacter sp. GXQ6167]|uniref:fasciclin domain-containing protein n=1 Tax=Janibacter sp. GXQ6167 TaxID=3240791 RepID=UPI0035242E38
MRRSLLIAPVAALALGLTACGSSDDSAATDTTTTSPMTSETTTSQSPMPEEKDIVDTAVAAGSFKTLATALTEAGLVDTLKGDGPFTVFAPTDEAFDKLPDGTLDSLLASPEDKLKPILTYHVVEGKVLAKDVATMDGEKVKTVNGAELTIEVGGDEVMLVDATGAKAKVTQPDVMASNGVIHVIDTVLMPTK